MRLVSVTYSEFKGQDREWSLDTLSLGAKNLIVGRNSTGKTRSLNIIVSAARTILGLQGASMSGDFSLVWEGDKGEIYTYSYEVDSQTVVRESLNVDGCELLHRGPDGIGLIYAEKIKGKLEFQMPQNELALVKRRDLIQHSYMEPIFNWAGSVRHYHFGSHFGKEIIAVISPVSITVDERDENAVVAVLRAGTKEFGEKYTDAIIDDMAKVGFNIEYITTGAPITITFQGAPGEIASIKVKQKEFNGIVDQWSMSQGMYRLLSLFIHVNYMELKKSGACVLVDDIGEGLDFERSCQAINLLREKADRSNLQVIMSTNDRFVMNEVPLKEWTVLRRVGSHVEVKNYENSAPQFDEFRYTGLSNFSFFELDYLNTDGAPS